MRIIINIKKSNVIHFRSTKKKQSDVKFYINKQVVEYTSCYKYLGIYCDEHLKFHEAISTLSNSGSRALGSIIHKYKANKYMGLSTYSKLYESCVLPVLNYCSIVWAHADCSKSDQVQYKAMGVFMGVHKHAPLLGII